MVPVLFLVESLQDYEVKSHRVPSSLSHHVTQAKGSKRKIIMNVKRVAILKLVNYDKSFI